MNIPGPLLATLRELPGRCRECGWAIREQGHDPACMEPLTLGCVGMGVAEAADKTGEAALIDAAIERQPLIGARVNAFATRGAIREVGRVRSTKGNTHGHEIKVWQATR